MVLVYTTSGECVEIEEAVRAESTQTELRCFDATGCVVRSFNAKDITMFTNDPEMAEIISEEVCEDDEEAASATL